MAVLSAMDRQILAVVVEPVKAEFGLSDLQIGLVSGLGFALSFSLLGVPLGRVADRVERRSLIAFTRGLGGLVAALAAGATGFWTLMVSRSGSALSDAGGAPASMSLIADLYAPAQRSRAMSVFGVGSALGAMLALVLGSWMAQRWGWRATLAIVGASAVVPALMLRLFMREPPRGAAPQIVQDASGAGAVALVWRAPVARWLMVGAAFTLLAGYSFGAWNFSYLVRSHGLSLRHAGWVSGLAAIASVAGSLVAGALADRLVRRRHARWQIGVPLCGVTLAMPIGLLYFALPAGQAGAAALMVSLFAFFIAWWVAPCYAALSLVVPHQRRATASAMVMLAGSIVGGGIGPIFTGALSAWLTPWLHGQALRAALICTVALMSLSVYAFWRAMRAYPAALRGMADSAAATPAQPAV
ncbi:MFS transporter [Massilia cavernae]|uniref:MFS transporter n=2 Tax=Massilia cavernae TaxID=2320864 RepID=A0A418Y100_9BURK|nr:MFS transporter [Massilia cavernae]